ncbi:MAG: F0F1 ATP synthase subunit epsilon [Firmicutes bacterium]|uniref:ATP synthase epsilon chain n=1 Tax=Candidatus Gallilactobacillus intestinavium TaxID=2840838 RepID=A0A9D9H995_9LACO|nr:F0F1 ATP synthase subunit epsilon [Candidatus Gallilactobacillus intestinavium]
MDDEKYLSVNIVTPDGSKYSNDKVSMCLLRTLTGELGILPNHVPIIASLDIDQVKIKYGDKEDKIAVNGGFVEFSNNIATIVADSAETEDEIDLQRANKAKSEAENKINKAQSVNDSDELKRAEVSLKKAINRINVASQKMNK